MNIYQMILSNSVGLLHNLVVVFLGIALGAFPIALAFMVIRFFVGFDCILKEWRHSSLIQFYSAIFIAAVICAVGLLNIPVGFIPKSFAFALASKLWWIAVIVGVFFIFFYSI